MDLFLSILFSTIALAFCTYGKKQQALVPFCAGLVLLLLQYAIDNTLWLIISSLICCAIPFFLVHRVFPGKAALIFRKKYSESRNP